MRKGYYMTIDVTVAAGLAMLIVMALLIAFANIPRSDMVELANYKSGESVLYSLRHDGTLQQAVGLLDEGKAGQARGIVVSALARMNLPMHSAVEIKTYDQAMAPVHSFRAQKGPATERKYVVSIPFKPGSSPSKYAIATIEVGT